MPKSSPSTGRRPANSPGRARAKKSAPASTDQAGTQDQPDKRPVDDPNFTRERGGDTRPPSHDGRSQVNSAAAGESYGGQDSRDQSKQDRTTSRGSPGAAAQDGSAQTSPPERESQPVADEGRDAARAGQANEAAQVENRWETATGDDDQADRPATRGTEEGSGLDELTDGDSSRSEQFNAYDRQQGSDTRLVGGRAPDDPARADRTSEAARKNARPK